MGDNDRYMKMMKEGYQLQHPENEYLDLCRNAFWKQGNKKGDRTGTGTLCLFLVTKCDLIYKKDFHC